jgi:hypothetical protein
VDLAGIRAGMATVVRTALPELTCYEFVPAAVEVPCFYSTGPTITYDVTFGGTDDMDNWVCRVLVSKADDADGQALLDDYLSRGDKSVKLALEGTPGVAQTLNGVISDLHVRRAQNYGFFQHGDEYYYGAELIVHVIGEPEA